MSETATSTTTTTTASAQSGWAGPCSWPVAYAWCGQDEGVRATLPPEELARVERMAIEYLWNWTGQQFGLCESTIRPCRSDCFEASVPTVDWVRARVEARAGSSAVWGPVYINGRWYTLGCTSCGTTCRCTGGPFELQLPGNVHSISDVTIGAVTLSTSQYELRPGGKLARLDGDPWPPCQNLNLPLGQADTWSVTLLSGIPVPDGGQMAAGLLVEEFAKALCKDKTCALPQRWQTITRQGVTVTTQDQFEDLEKGHTGIWLIDSWVASIKAPRRRTSSVVSPDYRARYRRV